MIANTPKSLIVSLLLVLTIGSILLLAACSTSAAPSALDEICVDLALSPEECANRGAHRYAELSTIDEPCWWNETGTNTMTDEVEKNWTFTESTANDGNITYEEVLPGLYGYEYSNRLGTFTLRLTFQMEGYTKTSTPDNENSCASTSVYTFLEADKK